MDEFVCRILDENSYEEATVTKWHPDWYWIEWDFDTSFDWSGSITKVMFEKEVSEGKYTILNNKD